MNYELRKYQKKAVIAGLETFMKKKRSVAVLPTGSGKSLVIANVAKELLGNTIVFQPNKEILEQNLEKMKMFGYGDECAVFSASLGSKEVGKITFATIGSIYNRKELWGLFDNVIIDECHEINPEKGMYKDFIKAHGGAVFGLTATPYRFHQFSDAEEEKYVVAKFLHRTQPRVFSEISHITQIDELYRDGFLSPIDYEINDMYKHDEIKLNTTGRDFDDKSLRLYNREKDIVQLVSKAVRVQNRHHILVFNKFVEEAEALRDKLNNYGISSATISADTPTAEREQIISDFRNGDIRVVTNVGVLTRGFDFPELDCVILARPTQSVALYYQMIGRGIRVAEGKENVKVIDVCGNVQRFGKIEDFKIEARENHPSMLRLKSEVGFLTGFDFVHGIDLEKENYRSVIKGRGGVSKYDRYKYQKEKGVGNNIVSFGQYKGVNISKVPLSYIQWVLQKKGFKFIVKGERGMFENELERRQSTPIDLR